MRIIIASQDWDYRFARPQHFARILAEQHRVVYLATGPDIRSRIVDAIRGQTRWRPLHYRVKPGIDVFSALYPKGHGDARGIIRDCRLNAHLARLLYPGAFDTADIGIVTNPLHYETIRNLKWRRLIYDCLDRYEEFFPADSELRDLVLESERRLLTEADIVFVSSRLLYEEKSRVRKVYYLPHGVEVEHFADAGGPKPAELRPLQGPVVGFVGGIEDWVNLSWIASAAQKIPDADFVLVGDIRVGDDALPRGANIHFLGYRHYADLPKYVNNFDVCVIPFQTNKLTAAVNPIKVLEYFAAAKPVVASHMPELEQYEPYIRLVRSADDFVREVAAALASDCREFKHARRSIAETRSWRRIVSQFLDVLSGKASDPSDETDVPV